MLLKEEVFIFQELIFKINNRVMKGKEYNHQKERQKLIEERDIVKVASYFGSVHFI